MVSVAAAGVGWMDNESPSVHFMALLLVVAQDPNRQVAIEPFIFLGSLCSGDV